MRLHKLIICFFAVVLLVQVLCNIGITGDTRLNAPSHLRAWHSGTYVQLGWDLNPDEQIAGYNIYRSVNLNGEWHKLNPSTFPLTVFVDYSPFSDEVVYYKVTAVEIDGNESQASIPIEVKFRRITKKQAMQGLEAVSFDKNNIIANQQLLNASAMTLQQIQAFLDSWDSGLANLLISEKTAAQHIYDACQTYSISPYVVLATLQKEQSLITTENPSQQQLDWAMGWGDPSNFADQVQYGTRQFKLYYDNLGNYTDVAGVPWSVGELHTVWDGTVAPANIATAGLYIYTPWIGQGGGGQVGVGGNYLFWDLWYNTFQFSEPASIPSEVLSPVVGDLEVVYSLEQCSNTKWGSVSDLLILKYLTQRR